MSCIDLDRELVGLKTIPERYENISIFFTFKTNELHFDASPHQYSYLLRKCPHPLLFNSMYNKLKYYSIIIGVLKEIPEISIFDPINEKYYARSIYESFLYYNICRDDNIIYYKLGNTIIFVSRKGVEKNYIYNLTHRIQTEMYYKIFMNYNLHKSFYFDPRAIIYTLKKYDYYMPDMDDPD